MSNEYRYAYCRFKNKKTNKSVTVIGQPDIEIIEKSGKYSMVESLIIMINNKKIFRRIKISRCGLDRL